MKISDFGIEKLKDFEGLRLRAYKDSAGIWTVGYGHTTDKNLTVTALTEINEQEAERLLRLDVREAEDAVNKLVKVPLNQFQFDALGSFTYNIGITQFEKSTLLRKLNAGDYESVPGELIKWTKAGGKTVKGLVNRRAAEAGMWATQAFVSSASVPAAAPAKPVSELPFTPEVIGTIATVGTGCISALAGLQTPVAFAVLAVLVLFGIYVIWRIRLRDAG